MTFSRAGIEFWRRPGGVAVVATLWLFAGSATAVAVEQGHILIADQFNNRVIEVDAQTHKVVWQFGNGSDIPGPHSVIGVNDAERFGPYTLISGTGTPPSDPALPGCSTPSVGCADNRVFIVDRSARIVWQYGKAGVTGADRNELSAPVQATFLSGFPGHPGFSVLITDQGNARVIVVDLLTKDIVWQYGTTGVTGSADDQLNNPNSGEVLENGNILIADEGNNRAIEVTPAKHVVHVYTAGGTLSGVAFASRLDNGNTLISDANNNRIVEVNGTDQIVWQYATNTQPGSNPAPAPTRGVRLRNGDTLISDQFNNRVIEIDHEGQIVFTQGVLNVMGAGFDMLNGPYDAKVIGDNTGLTPPFDLDGDKDDH